MKFFLIGALGGIATNIFRIGVDCIQGTFEMPDISYLLGLIIFAFLGGMIVVLWKETDMRKAFYLGLGLPAVLQGGLSEIEMNKLPEYASRIFINEVYAAAPIHSIEGRQIKLHVEKDIYTFTVEFSSDDSISTAIQDRIPDGRFITIDVPAFANSIKITVKNVPSNELGITETPNSIMEIKLMKKDKSWRGFMQSLGIKQVNKFDVIILESR